jgi:hypothetical protein
VLAAKNFFRSKYSPVEYLDQQIELFFFALRYVGEQLNIPTVLAPIAVQHTLTPVLRIFQIHPAPADPLFLQVSHQTSL